MERTHVPRRPCLGDDDYNDATDIQNTHSQPSLFILDFQPGKGKAPSAMCSPWQ